MNFTLEQNELLQKTANALVAYEKQEDKKQSLIGDLAKLIMLTGDRTAFDYIKDAFKGAFTNSANQAGWNDEKKAKKRASDYFSKAKASAVFLGWQEPPNPSKRAKPKSEKDIKNPTVKLELNGVKAQIVIDDDTIREIVSLLISKCPKSVFFSLFNRDGSITQAFLRKSGIEGELIAGDIKDKLKCSIDDKLKALIKKNAEPLDTHE